MNIRYGINGLLFLLCLPLVTSRVRKPRNVVFVILDDFRPAIRGLGDSLAYTPNLDNLLKTSFYFENCFAQQSLCAPSRNSLLTSRRPDTLRLYDFYSYWRTSSGNFTTLPQYLKDHDFFAYSIGKIFHPGASSNYNDDYPISWSSEAFHPSTERFMNSGWCRDKHSPKKFVKNLNCPVKLKDVPQHTLPDIQSVQMATSFIKQVKNRFFLAVGLHKPHIPFQFPRKYLKYHPIEKFKDYSPGMNFKPFGMPNVAWNPYTDLRKREDVIRLNVSIPFGPIPLDFAATIRQHYYASVSYVDNLLGKLFRAMDARNTLLLLTSDHGWSLGEHGEWAKYSNFDVGLKVPLIIRLPNQKRGFRMRNMAELLDIFPTVVDLLSLPKIPACLKHTSQPLCTEGKSLSPLLKRRRLRSYAGISMNDMAFSQYPRPGDYPTLKPNSDRPKLSQINIMGYSVRLQRFRFTTWVRFNPSTFEVSWREVHGEELYDHWIDPQERMNLVGHPEFKALIRQLRRILIDKHQGKYLNINLTQPD